MPRVVAGLRGWGHETIDIKVPTVGKMMKYYLFHTPENLYSLLYATAVDPLLTHTSRRMAIRGYGDYVKRYGLKGVRSIMMIVMIDDHLIFSFIFQNSFDPCKTILLPSNCLL